MDILFATNNEHKINEIKNLLGSRYHILGLDDAGITEEIPENEETLEGNALAKSRYVYNLTGVNVFADDTGLEVRSLGNRPGVHSARYAGNGRDSNDNMEKVLAEMEDLHDRSARFRTVIALILDGKEYLFEGIVEGKIIMEKRGKEGFGYDPIFIASGLDKTFAEISLEEKNMISHRARAIKKLTDFLDRQ